MQSRAFTKLFASITDSSIWSEDDATRIIWITMLAMADARGYVGASIPGLAARSRKTVAEVEAALQKFLAPDPYSRTTAHEGRRVETVEGGWRLLNYERHRAVARAESVRESKRFYAAKQRAEAVSLNASEHSRNPSNDVELSRTESNSVELESNSPSASPSPSGSESDQDPDPRDQVTTARARGFDAPVLPTVVRTLDGWTLSPELRAEAIAAGVHPEDVDRRIADLRTGTIGGARGVLAHKVDDYIRAQFSKWRTWGETDRAKAAARAAAGPSARFGQGPAGSVATDPKDAPKRLPGLPPWVYEKHAEIATAHGIDIKRAAREFVKTYHLPVASMRVGDVFAPFMTYLLQQGGEACR